MDSQGIFWCGRIGLQSEVKQSIEYYCWNFIIYKYLLLMNERLGWVAAICFQVKCLLDNIDILFDINRSIPNTPLVPYVLYFIS